MLNQSGVTTTNYTSDKQILVNVELQASVGCIVPATMGVTSGAKKIVFAGTPIKIDFDNIQTPAVVGDGTNAMNAVLLHNVDVTNGAANGTALIFGFVNIIGKQWIQSFINQCRFTGTTHTCNANK